MPHHADSSLVPSSIRTKSQFWGYIISQLISLLDGQRHWVKQFIALFFFSFPYLTFVMPSYRPSLRRRICRAHYQQVTNLANTSSLVYHSLLSYPAFGDGPSSVNWCGEALSFMRPRSQHAPRPPRLVQLPVDRGLPTGKKRFKHPPSK